MAVASRRVMSARIGPPRRASEKTLHAAAMGLTEYKRKRRFGVTSEPAGKAPRAKRTKRLAFVVQKHRASRLHYDFRLEWQGVLLSWAVPKGPSLDPRVKRLAMQTEDHPIEYAKFEGIIPEGEYGGGTVMIWDRGAWTPETDDVDAALQKGELKFRLEGEKLTGSWVLVRTRGRPGDAASRPPWLLIKHRDEAASEVDIAESLPRSVVSQRLLAEIAWHEGGNVAKAAGGDPTSELQKLVKNPASVAARGRGKKPAVWRSKRARS
jgi:bifunctional non-homologous end joining protein LigD